jgi:hypothetical protein
VGSGAFSKRQVGYQAAFASKLSSYKIKIKRSQPAAAPTWIRGAAAPLNRMSASSAAAFDLDLDPRAKSEG